MLQNITLFETNFTLQPSTITYRSALHDQHPACYDLLHPSTKELATGRRRGWPRS